jgi:hypothetical protein
MALNLVNKYIKTTWTRGNILILFIFISFVGVNKGLNSAVSHQHLGRRLNKNISHSLIGEWNEQTNGRYILLNDVYISNTINVDNGDVLDITGIVGMDGKRPAIDGGGTPGCAQIKHKDPVSCPGHRVFYVGQHKPSNLTLTNVTIRNGFGRYLSLYNEARGGGFYINSGEVHLTSCVVVNNTGYSHSSFRAGGFYIGNGVVHLTSCKILNNAAPSGAGFYIDGGEVHLATCTISNNTAGFSGGGFYIHNGKVYLRTCTISSNIAFGGEYGWGRQYSGGGFYITGGNVRLTKSTISRNRAGFSTTGNQVGGGLFINSAQVNLTTCTISGNAAGGQGGGIRIESGDVSIVKNYFSDNDAGVMIPKRYLNNGNDIAAVPTIIMINTTFSNASNSIIGTPSQCLPSLCQDFIPSYPDFGIECASKPNKHQGIECFPCHPGKYLRANAPYSSCLPCVAGTATNKYGSDSCDTCSPGKIQPVNTNASLCKLCSPGKYSNNRIKCNDVPPGYHPSNCIDSNAKKGCSSFAPCPHGFASSKAGQSKCERCSPGMTTFVEGSIKCSSCQKGTAGTNGTCTPCTGLTHASNINSTTCEYCSDIRKVPDSSHIDCIKQEGIAGNGPIIYDVHVESRISKLSFKFKFVNSVVHSWIQDYVLVTATNAITKDVIAKSKFPAADLHENFTGFTGLPITDVQFIFSAIMVYTNNKRSKPYIYPFSSWTTTSSCNSDSLYLNASSHKLANWKCVKCPEAASCDGKITQDGIKARFGNWQVPNTLIFSKCLRPQSCLGATNKLYYNRFPKLAKTNHNVSCAIPGYVQGSRLCATCNRPQFARGTGKGACVKCHKTWNVIIFIASIIFGLTGFTIFLRMTLFKRRIVKLSDGIKKIAINYLQFASLALNLDMPWTNALNQLFQMQSYGVGVSNALLSLDCILADTSTTWDVFQLKFFGTLILPILFIPIAYVIVKYVLHGGWDEFVASLILFCYLIYPKIVKSTTTLFSCTNMINGTRYMIVDPAIKCFDYSTSVWIGIVLSFLVYIVGMPVISYLVVKRLDRSIPENRLKFGKLPAPFLWSKAHMNPNYI